MRRRFLLLALLPAIAVADAPSIGSVTVSQDAASRRIEVQYELAGSPAIVTVEFMTNTVADASGNWVSVGTANVTHVVGDAFRVVQTGDRKLHWLAEEPFPFADLGAVRAVVKVWSEEAPPPVRLNDSVSALVWYYEDVAQIPAAFSGTGFTQTVSGANSPASTASGDATGIENAHESRLASANDISTIDTRYVTFGYAELDNFNSNTHYGTKFIVK